MPDQRAFYGAIAVQTPMSPGKALAHNRGFMRGTPMSAVETGNANFRTNYARALAGALIFAFPLLMTMEMWWFGMYMDRFRLALFILLFLPLLTGLSRYSGFRETINWYDDSIDALVAFSAGVIVAVVFLLVFGIVGIAEEPFEEAVPFHGRTVQHGSHCSGWGRKASFRYFIKGAVLVHFLHE